MGVGSFINTDEVLIRILIARVLASNGRPRPQSLRSYELVPVVVMSAIAFMLIRFALGCTIADAPITAHGLQEGGPGLM